MISCKNHSQILKNLEEPTISKYEEFSTMSQCFEKEVLLKSLQLNFPFANSLVANVLQSSIAVQE